MRLPKYIEPRKLAQKNGLFDGFLLPQDMPRVMEVIDSCEKISAKLEFDIDIERRRVMQGTISGSVNLLCQRCLTPVAQHLESRVNLAMVWTEEQAENLPDSVEPWIVGEDPEDLHAIIEEEILLSLPVVAYHDHQCIDATVLSAGDDKSEPEKKTNPFQALAVLKNTSNKPN